MTDRLEICSVARRKEAFGVNGMRRVFTQRVQMSNSGCKFNSVA